MALTNRLTPQKNHEENPGHFWARFILKPRTRRARYTGVLAISVAGLGLTLAVQLFDKGHLYSISLAAVILSALYGGRGPALMSAALSVATIDYFFIEPMHMIFRSPVAVLRLGLYFSTAVLISMVTARLRLTVQQLDEAQKQSNQAVQARANVLAVVSHDLKNPITATLMNADLLRRLIPASVPAGESRDRLLEVVNSVHSASARMNRLVKDLLDATKIESGAFTVNAGRTRARHLISDAVKLCERQAAEKNVRFELRFENQPDGHEDELTCDVDQIVRALSNLISNAIKFSPPGAVVTIQSERFLDSIHFSVTDEGPGIPEEDVPRLFSRYWQAESTSRLGSGLGLFIVRGILQAHGGEVGVDSKVGVGSTFHFTVPISPPSASNPPKPLTIRSEPPSRRASPIARGF